MKGREILLWIIFVALLILWMLGLVNDFGGASIHLLLVAAALVLVFTLLGGRKRAA